MNGNLDKSKSAICQGILSLLFFLTTALSPLGAASDEAPTLYDFSSLKIEARTTSEPIQVSLLSEQEAIQPGVPFWVALKISVAEGWHTYWRNPGDTGIACSIEWFLPEGFKVGECQWPAPERFTEGPLTYFGYKGEFALLAQVTPPKHFKPAPSETVQIGATLRWVACNQENCLPGDSEPSLTLSLSKKEGSVEKQQHAFFEAARARLPQGDWQISAKRTEPGVIHLNIASPKTAPSSLVGADFFPEHSKGVDYHYLPLLASTANGNYQMRILESPGHAAPLEALRGVAILHTSDDSQSQVVVDVPILHALAKPNYEHTEGLLLTLFLAFLGGVLLNLMPCVLPVISIKVLHLVKMAGSSRRLTLLNGLAFTLGILLSFWVLTALILVLQAYGRSVGWGFQLQESWFVGGLAAILLIFGLNLFGLFEFGTLFASWAGQKENKVARHNQGFTAAFFSGILATTMAAPCTGPFLGSAVGVAVTLPPLAAFAIFTFIGLGMSLPYFLLTAFPSLLNWVPRPGPWMIYFKQFLGFLILSTVLWLTWVFASQTGTVGLFTLLAAFFVIALACWIYGNGASPHRSKRTQLVSTLCSALLLLMGGAMTLTAARNVSTVALKEVADENGWISFSHAQFQKARAAGKPIFIDFTAKWCLICQANHYVLEVDQVRQKFEEAGVVKLEADWTRSDPIITEELRKHGRNGVPLYLLYLPKQEKPLILPQLLTPEIVLKHLSQL